MTYTELWRPLTAIYDEDEARAVARLVLEVRFGLSFADVLSGRTGDDQELRRIQQRLLTGEPVQYVLGQAEFGPRKFRVAPGVLIPRPETYELCQWIVEESEKRREGVCSILDIGTGSGCIACTLAAELPQATVAGWDISEEALCIARENAERIGVNVSFEQVDALHPSPSTLHPSLFTLHPSPFTPHPSPLTIIVSNPPYICQREATSMEHNVLDYEPHTALFVPDDDPLLFYRVISDYALQALEPGGVLYFEINPLYADALYEHLQAKGFCVEQRRDQFGKIRFIKAERP